jgi:hypothetical protein
MLQKSSIIANTFQFDFKQDNNANSNCLFTPLLNLESDINKSDEKDSSYQLSGYKFNFFD